MRLAWWKGYISYYRQEVKHTHLCFSFQNMDGVSLCSRNV